MMNKNLCFLDLEATGFHKQKDSIIEVALVIRNPQNQIIQKFESVFTPDKNKLTDFIAQLTKISQDEIDTTGKNLVDYTDQLKEMIGDAVIVGHNIDFDIEFLTANGVDLSHNDRIDTHELSRVLLVNEESYALEVLAHKYKFEQTSAHRAMSDVEVNIEVYDWLVQHINSLPSDFIETITPTLSQKSSWFAKQLFFDRGTAVIEANQATDGAKKKFAPRALVELGAPIALSQHTFIRAGNNVNNAQAQLQLAAQETKSVIVTDKIDYFPQLKAIPTPDVVFCRHYLQTFVDNRPTLDDEMSTFYVQCAWRNHLGHRGKKYFDLFFKQRDLWREVCLQDTEKDIAVFEEILADRRDEKVLVVSPYGYFALKDTPILKDRTLIVDEIEKFAEKLLLSVTAEHKIDRYLSNETTTVAAQFWVRNVCRDVLEKILQKSLPPFPSKVLLPTGATYPDLADAWEAFCDPCDKVAATHLRTAMDGVVRWINYYPSTGNITIGIWSSAAWKNSRDHLARQKIVAFTRAPQSENMLQFSKYFLSLREPIWKEISGLATSYKLTIPHDLISVKSPDFNQFTADKIREYAKTLPAGERLVANFSSQDSLQKVYTNLKLGETITDDFYSILGERASGGTGKVAYLATQGNNKVLCTQRSEKADLSALPYTKFLVQKFPFNPPHPLLNRIEDILKQKGKNFWDIWIMTQVGANLARRAAVFPDIKEIIVLDGRENSRWGKGLLHQAFL